MIRRTAHLIVSAAILALAVLSSQSAQMFAASTTSGHAIYGEGSVITPRHRRWNGAGFDAETSALATNDVIQWVVAKTSPAADEMTMGVLSDRNNEIHIQTWDGSAWTANWTANWESATKRAKLRNYDIAYESVSADAIVTYGDAANNLMFRKRINGVWDSADQLVTNLGSMINFVRAKADPASDDVFVAVVTNNGVLHALRWDGNNNSWGDQITMPGVGNKNTECFDITFETGSGDAFLIWGDSGKNLKFRKFTTSWGAETIAYSGLSDVAHWVVAANDPRSTSSEIAVGMLTKRRRFEFGAWDGSGWVARPPSIAARVANNRGIDVTFETDTGQALYIFNQRADPAQMAWRTWTSTGGFGGVTVESGVAGDLNFMQLQADPRSNDVMALYGDTNADLFHRKWDGASWSALGAALEGELSSVTKSEPFMYVWDIEPVTTVPVTITNVTLIETSMTPQLQYTVTVSVSYDAGMADLDTLVLKIYHDSDGGLPTDAEAVAQSADSQNCATITWTQSADSFTMDPSGAGTTWSLGSSLSPASLPGDFTFVFTPGKVATETAGPAVWQLWAQVTDDGGQTATNYDPSPPTMNWYGEITINTPSVDWGTVDLGTGFADNTNEMGNVSVTYISNGDYDQQVKSDAAWTGGLKDGIFDATGACDDAQEFSLMACETDTFGSALQVDTSGVSFNATGTQTGETGNVAATNTLWLKLASVFGADTYNGNITYIIADR